MGMGVAPFDTRPYVGVNQLPPVVTIPEPKVRPDITGARAKAWCLLIHSEASLSRPGITWRRYDADMPCRVTVVCLVDVLRAHGMLSAHISECQC